MKKLRNIADTKIRKVSNDIVEKEEKNEVSDILYSGLKEKSTAVSVGKSGKIIVKEKTPSSSVEFFGIQSQQVAVQSTTPTITVNLNGNFHGCRFSLGESSSRNL